MKWLKLGITLVVVTIFLLAERGGEVALGVVADDDVGLVMVSAKRRMINVLEISGEEKLWIPGGWGWYAGNKLKKLAQQEKWLELPANIWFFNFGFSPDRVVTAEKFDDWQDDGWWLKTLGWRNWWLWRKAKEEWVVNKVKVDKLGDFLETKGEKVMVRDFARSGVLSSEKKLSVFNTTGLSGMADFLANRLTWAGWTVAESGNREERVEKCAIRFGGKGLGTELKKVVDGWGCWISGEKEIGENEVEIILGDGWGEMIKYRSYSK